MFKRWKQKLVAAALLFFVVFGMSSAQTSSDIKTDLSDKQRELAEIQKQIQDLQREIGTTQKKTASLKNEVALFDLNIRQTEAKIRATQLEIDSLRLEIASTTAQIQEKEEQIEKEKNFLSESLRLINENDAVSALEMALANDTFSEFLDQVTYASNLQEKIQDLLNEIKSLKTQLENKKVELATQVANEEKAKSELVAANDSLNSQRNQKAGLLAETRGQERIYQSLLTDASQKQEQIEREIYDLEVAIRQQFGDKSLPPSAGLLRWPMSGILTQGYGKTGFTALGYNFHNGLDIAGPAGTTIYAAADGIVYATGRGKAAYGNWVVLKHAISKDGKIYNIYTLYAHMSNFAVSAGQTIHAGDVVGHEGNTGNTTRLLYGPERGYHLHFTIFDEDGFGIQGGEYQHIYGPYQIPYGYTYNPLDFLK